MNEKEEHLRSIIENQKDEIKLYESIIGDLIWFMDRLSDPALKDEVDQVKERFKGILTIN